MNNNNLNVIKTYTEKYLNSGMSSTELAKLILSENPGMEIKLQTLSLMIYELMSEQRDHKSPSEKTIDIDDTHTGEKYQIVDDHYIWDSKKAGKIKISIEDADKLFFEYSVFGLDLSQEQVRRKHGFSIPQWNTIKATLWLYKKSNIFSPYTADKTPTENLQTMMQEKLQMKYNDKNRMIEDEARKHTIKEYKKVIRDSSIDKFASNEFLHELNSLLPDREIIKINTSVCKKDSPVDVFAAIADLHVGAKSEGLLKTPDFNMEILKARLSEVADRINEQHGKNVTVSVLGDLIESFTGMNHPNSWQSMEFGVYGAKAVFAAYSVLSDFFNKINNLKNIKLIGGNHDRSTSDNKIDRKSTIAELVFLMLEEKYGKIYDIEYSCLILTHDLPNTKLILSHGDRKILKSAGTSLDAKVIEHGDVSKFNIILTGHLHSRGVNEDKVHYRWYKVPSIFSGNFYSEENSWNAKPGFFIIKEDTHSKLPIVIDHPLSI